MKKKIVSKILSLLLLGEILISCEQPVVSDTDNNKDKVKVPAENGISNWSEFKEKAGSDFLIPIDNIDEIKGFKGYSNYSELKKFFASSQYFPEGCEKRYNTSDLKIFFDTYSTSLNNTDNSTEASSTDTTDDITPSILNEIYKHFTVVNLTSTNQATGGMEYIKISSGKNNEVFDINKFSARIEKSEFSIDGITTQTSTNKMLIGIDDEYLTGNSSVDYDALVDILKHDVFKNAQIAKIKLSGNISKIEELYSREAEEKNITFTSDAYSSPRSDEKDILSLEELKERQERGFHIHLSNTEIFSNNFKDATSDITQDTIPTVDFSNSTLENVTFARDTDLTNSSFNYVKSKGNLVFEGILPSQMKYLTADNVIFNNARAVKYTPEDTTSSTPASGGTNITSANIKSLTVNGSVINSDSFIADENTTGTIENFKGNKDLYDTLIKIITIKNQDVKVEIVKFIIKNQKQYI